MRKTCLYAISLCVCFIYGCNSIIEPRSLVGASKEEILRLVFEKCPKNSNVEINICIVTVELTGKQSYQNIYCKSFNDAKNNINLMKSKIWLIDKKNKFSFSIYQKEEWIELRFEDGKVIKAERIYWDKT